MENKSASKVMTFIFGFYGFVVVALAWALPSLESERLMATLVGVSGIVIAGISARGLRWKINGEREQRAPVEVEVEKR